MPDPIPNLFDKYGGTAVITVLVREFSTAVLTDVSLRRFLADRPITEVASLNLELLAFALGRPVATYQPPDAQLGYASLHLTTHAYDRLQALLRHVLLQHGFESRDIVIAMNVLDMHAESLMNVRIPRRVTSPFAGVDRRRLPRDPELTSENQRRPVREDSSRTG